MNDGNWQRFTFHLRLHLSEQDFEAEVLVLTRGEEDLRRIGALLAYLYRAALAR